MKKLLSILIAIALMAAMSVTAFAEETTYYDLWVAGVQITSANPVIDSTDNGQIQGSATFDEATKTFTLTNFKYTGAHDHGSDYDTSALNVGVDGITIVFSGENIIESTGDYGLYAAVYENIKLKAADENSTLTFKCENNNAFAHEPVLVGDIDIYAGSNEDDATLLAYGVFTEYPYSYKYVRFVPAEPEPETQTTTVTYQVDPTFTVTIPATVALGEDVTISADNVVVKKGQQVEVSLTDSSGFAVTSAEGAQLIYTVKNGDTAVAEGDTVLAVNPGDGKTGSTTLTFVAPTEYTYSGDYTGTVIFTVAVKDVPMINFTFDGTAYQAEEGMTLCQWAESEYDVNDKYCDAGDGTVKDKATWRYREDAVIVDGEEYRLRA